MVKAKHRYGTTGPVGPPKFGSGATTASLTQNQTDDASTWIDLTAYDSMSREDEERDDGTSTEWQDNQPRTSSPRVAPESQSRSDDKKLHNILDGISDMVIRESPFSLAATLSGEDGVPIHVWESTTHSDASALEKPAPVIRLWDAESPPRPENPVNGLSRYQKALVRLDGVRRQTAERSATMAKDTDILSSKHEQLIQQNTSLQTHHSFHRHADLIIQVEDDGDDYARSDESSRSRGRTTAHRLFIDTSAMEDAYEDAASRRGGAASVKDFMTAFSYEFKNRMPDQPIDVINIDDIIMEQSSLDATTPRSTNRASGTAPRTPERYSGVTRGQTRRHHQLATDPLAFKRDLPATRRKLPTTNATLLSLSRSPPSSPLSSQSQSSSSSKRGKRVPTKLSLDLQRDKISAIRNTVKTLQQQKAAVTSPRREATRSRQQPQQELPQTQEVSSIPGNEDTNGDKEKVTDDSPGLAAVEVANIENVHSESPADAAKPALDTMPDMANESLVIHATLPIHNQDSTVEVASDANVSANANTTEKSGDSEPEQEEIQRKTKPMELPGVLMHESAKRIQDIFASRLAKIQGEVSKSDSGVSSDEKEPASMQLDRVVDTTLQSPDCPTSQQEEQLEIPSNEPEKPASPLNSLWVRNLQNRLAVKVKRTESDVSEETAASTDTKNEPLSHETAFLSSRVAVVEDRAIKMVPSEVLEVAESVVTVSNAGGDDNSRLNPVTPAETNEDADVLHDKPQSLKEPEICKKIEPLVEKLEPPGDHLEAAPANASIDDVLTADNQFEGNPNGSVEQNSPMAESNVESSEVAFNTNGDLRDDETLDAVFEIGFGKESEEETIDGTNEPEMSLTVGSITMEDDSSVPTEAESLNQPEDRNHFSNDRASSPRSCRDSTEKRDGKRGSLSNSKKDSEASGSEDNASFVTDLSASKVSIVDSETTDSEIEEEPEVVYGPCSGLPFAIQMLDVTCAWLEKEETSFCFQPSLLKKVKKRDTRRSDNKHSPSRPRMTSRIPHSAALSRCFGEDSKKPARENKYARPKPKLPLDTRGPPSRSSGSCRDESTKEIAHETLNVINVPIEQSETEPAEIVVTPTCSNVTKQLEAQQSEDTGPFFASSDARKNQGPIVLDGSVGTTEAESQGHDDELVEISEQVDSAQQELKEVEASATSAMEQIGMERSNFEAGTAEQSTLETCPMEERSRGPPRKPVESSDTTEVDPEAPNSVMSDEVTLKKGNQTSRLVTKEVGSFDYHDTAPQDTERKALDQIIEVKSEEDMPASHMSTFQQALRAKSLSPRSQYPSPAKFAQTHFDSNGTFPPVAPELSTQEQDPSPEILSTEAREIRLTRSMEFVPLGSKNTSTDCSPKADTIETCPSESSVEEAESLSRYRSRRECLAKLKKQLPRAGMFEGEDTTRKSLSENGVSMLNDQQRHAAMELAEKLKRRATTLNRRRKIRERRKELRVLATSPPTSPISTQGFSDFSV